MMVSLTRKYFPFIDNSGSIRAIQVKQFDEQNHTTGTDFLHSIIEKHHTKNNKPLPEWLEAYSKNETKVSCLFGEHLLNKYPNAAVYLFEAPKTAVYATLYFGEPEISNIICLAVYNKSSFSFEKLKALQGRFVYVFPDLSKGGNAFNEWETKAKEYESRLPGTHFIFSDLLEQLAPEQDKGEGKDLADYLVKQDWRLFGNAEKKMFSTKVILVIPVTDSYPKEWDQPCERNPVNDYWRAVNLWENLEGAMNENNAQRVNNAINDAYRFYGYEADLPTEIILKHAPTTFKKIFTDQI